MPLSVLNENKYNAAGNEYPWSRFTNRTNPYWVLAEQVHNIKRDRIFGNVTLRYELLKWLSVQGRFGQDYWSRDEDVNNFPTGQASRAAAPSRFCERHIYPGVAPLQGNEPRLPGECQ